MKRHSRTRSYVLLAILVCFSLSRYAFGQQMEKGTVEAAGAVGILSGIGTHGVVGGSVGVAIRNKLLVSGELSYIPLGSDSVDVLGVKSDFSAKAISFNFGGQYQLNRSRKMKPYIGAGVGFLHSSSSSSVTTSFEGFNFSGGSSGTSAYFNVGGGARYYVSQRWGFKPELMLFLGSRTFARIDGGIFYQFGK